MKNLTDEQRNKLAELERVNIMKRLQDGNTITSEQRAILYGLNERFAKNQTELARELDVDRKTIQRWRKQEDFPEPKADGRWDIVAVREWREQTRNYEPEEKSRSEGEARRVWLQVEKLEHELEVSRGKYIEIEEACAEIARLVAVTKSQLASLGNKLAPIVVGMATADAAERIDSEIDAALASLNKNILQEAVANDPK